MKDWLEVYRRFACLRPERSLDQDACQPVLEASPSHPVVVACSGGADSVFLSLAVLSLLEGRAACLHLAHFNHGLRGTASDADEAFVEEFARALGAGFSAGRPASRLPAREADLRHARYGWLAGRCRDLEAVCLALGHHGDDLVESLLMALFSGSGPGGLSSPAPVRRFEDGTLRVRPMLGLNRAAIEGHLVEVGAPWREDASNEDPSHTRNRIRRDLIPRLQACLPQDIYSAASRSRFLMEEAVSALDAALPPDLSLADPFSLNLQGLDTLAPASAGLFRRVLQAWWMRHRPETPLPPRALDQLVRELPGGQVPVAVSVGALDGSSTLYKVCRGSDGWLRLVPEAESGWPAWAAGCHWEPEAGSLWLPNGAMLSAARVHLLPGEEPYRAADPACQAWLQPQAGALRVRDWQAGDRYQPLGSPGRRKLQDIFTDARISPEQKRSLPVIENGQGDILWVPGFPPAHAARIRSGDKTALKLTYYRPSTAFEYKHVGESHTQAQ